MREPWDRETEIPFARTPLVTDERRILLDKMKPDDLDRHSKDLHLKMMPAPQDSIVGTRVLNSMAYSATECLPC